MATGRVPTTANSPLTAKGDLFTYDTSQARLAVGNNGETLVADSSATTGLRWQQPKTQNAIFNSSMEITQRGTSFTTVSGVAYTLDRWSSWATTAGASLVTTQETGTANSRYSAKLRRSTGNTNTGALYFFQSLETADSLRFQGQTVTLSFYAKSGANFSSASSILGSVIAYGTGTDQIYYAYTGAVDNNKSNTITTSWQRFSHTVTLPSTATEVTVGFYFTPVGTAGADDSFFVTGVQLEVGSVATPYNRMSGTLAGELAACQRYYWRWSASNGAVYSFMGTGWVYSGTIFALPVVHPVQMRVAPTSIDTSGTASHYRVLVGATQYNNTSVPSLDQANAQTSSILFTNAGTMTAGQAGGAGANNTTSAYIGFNAEL